MNPAFLTHAVDRIEKANPDKDRKWAWDRLNSAISNRSEYQTLDDLDETLVRKILEANFGIKDY